MTTPYYADDAVTLYHGDALDVLRTLPDASVDAVVTDPPYGLEFMGREWDAPWKHGFAETGYTDAQRLARPNFGSTRNPMCRTCRKHKRGTDRCACPTPDFDETPADSSRLFQRWCEQWTVECLRVLKPGGHLLAFGGTRTVHRLTCAIEDAGFEIRDGIDWLYGSGFPKSLDVSKAIDKARDDRSDIHRVTSWLADQADAAGITRARVDAHMGTSDMAGWWLSRLRHRCQVPQWEQWERLRELIGFGADMDTEVWRLNGRKGTPGEAWAQREVVGPASWDNSARHFRPGEDHTQRVQLDVTAPATDDARRWSGWGTALKPAREPIVVARKPLAGTVAANVQAYGTGALNIDACRVDAGEPLVRPAIRRDDNAVLGRGLGVGVQTEPAGRWPSNVVLSHSEWCGEVCLPGCPVAELNRQSGYVPPSQRTARRDYEDRRDEHLRGIACPEGRQWGYTDSGGASRFFPVFRYQAKAPTRERPKVDGVAHPTVKPLALMRWLVRLVTPPGGVVLEPFAGSGTTAEACALEGFRCIAIERESAYLPLITARLSKRIQPALDLGGAA